MKKLKFLLVAFCICSLAVLSACDEDDDEYVEIHDPNTAEKVQVDRFSQAAGTLQVRTQGNGLPGPNVAVNFDQYPFITKGLGPSGELIEYYNFDVQPLGPAPIYVLFRQGETNPVEGQLNIIDKLPGEEGYNDFWLVVKVTVPTNYKANEVASYEEIVGRGYPLQPTSMIVNCPVVPEGSTASKRLTMETNQLVKGWYDEKIVFYFSFTEKALVTAGGNVPVSPIYVTFKADGSDFLTEDGSNSAVGQTHNVVATLPANAGYSPLWGVKVYDSTKFADVHDLATAEAVDSQSAVLVNCPIVKISN